MTEIPALYGRVAIRSFAAASDPFVGITYNQGGSYATVSIGQTDQNWTITTQPSGNGLRFSIGEYPYTGLGDDGQTIIATLTSSQDVAWNSTYNFDQEAYIISPWGDLSLSWTLQNPDATNSPIVLQSTDGSVSQAFQAEQLGSLD